VTWQDPNWAQHYVVYRAPAWHDIKCRFRNVQTGYVLQPYALAKFNDSTLTTAKYEQEMIPKVLQVGTQVRIIPRDEDKSWWESLWDDIVEFFKDTWEITNKLTNWVANAYNGLKQGLINFVASQIPIPGLKTALEGMVNYGLMALGLPPTLPNFDQLANMSVDYLAQVALTEAGIPANEITNELISQTSTGIRNEMKSAASSATPNPINSPFLKADPKYLYQPSWIEIEVSNPYTQATRAGTINVDVEWPWREDVQLVYETWSHLPPDQQYADALKYNLHFVYGLKYGHQGYPVYYPVYEPVRGYPIPILRPGDKRIVRIYLKEFIGRPYPFAALGDKVLGQDFANLYWGKCGNVKFSVSTGSFNLPDPKQGAIAQGHDPSGDYIYSYYWDRTYSADFFEGLPYLGRRP